MVAAESNDVVPGRGTRLRIQNTYDHQGRRRTKNTYSWDEQAEDWALDAERVFIYDVWNLAHELITDHTQSPAEESTKSYVWGLDLSQTLQGAGGVGGLLQATTQDDLSTTAYFATVDGNGNVVALVDSSDGTVAAEYDYSPFGKTVSMSGSAAGDNTFRFSTKYHDSETGLVYYGYRYYEPGIGRWINRDPIGELMSAEKSWTAVDDDEFPILDIDGTTLTESLHGADGRPFASPLWSFVGNDPQNDFDLFGLANASWAECYLAHYTGAGINLGDITSAMRACIGIGNPSQVLSCLVNRLGDMTAVTFAARVFCCRFDAGAYTFEDPCSTDQTVLGNCEDCCEFNECVFNMTTAVPPSVNRITQCYARDCSCAVPTGP